ncbi:MAG: hypothetical protein CM15mV22_1270 [Eurybiavirus sp.]|nr:MAG: hypothetical protein CM15mV22_1270 [Eurybiavirus sp.]
MAELFGFSFKKKVVQERAPSPIQPSSEDGLLVILQEVTTVSI